MIAADTERDVALDVASQPQAELIRASPPKLYGLQASLKDNFKEKWMKEFIEKEKCKRRMKRIYVAIRW